MRVARKVWIGHGVHLMTRAELIERLHATRREMDWLLRQVGTSRMTIPGATGDWSVKDVLAHLTWYVREETELIREDGVEASPIWQLPESERNAAIAEQLGGLSLEDVLVSYRQEFDRLVTAVEQLSDADLSTPGRFPGTSAESLPWQDIAGNSYLHEQEHIEMLRHRAEQS
jgi:DinB superfamily